MEDNWTVIYVIIFVSNASECMTDRYQIIYL